jgi:hypothetical protein
MHINVCVAFTESPILIGTGAQFLGLIVTAYLAGARLQAHDNLTTIRAETSGKRER